MFLETRHLTPWIALILISGCDDRVTQIAREAADRQAQQNTEMARLNQEVATGSHELVEADAKARREVIGVHRDLQKERSQLNIGWDELEQERRSITSQRRTESLLVSVTTLVGEVSLVLAVLGFCWYVLVGVHRGDETDSQLNELLVSEILTDELLKLPDERQFPSLPSPAAQNHPLKG